MKRLGILGTGLIGGSIGLRARELGFRVTGFDSDPEALQCALERGCIDDSAERETVYLRSEIVVLAMPAGQTVAELEMLDPALPANLELLMDVASVKEPVVRAARGLHSFVATHPMAGSERSGCAAAQAGLFQGKSWAYVPASGAATRRAVEFISALGGNPVAVDAAAHDATVALTSHAPQVFAWLFAQRFAELGDCAAGALCGPVATELLRIAGSSRRMWDGVLEFNAANVARELRGLACALEARAERYIRNTP